MGQGDRHRSQTPDSSYGSFPSCMPIPVSKLLSNPHAGDVDAADGGGGDAIDLVIAAGLVERLAGQGGHQLDRSEAGVAGGGLAEVEDKTADAAALEIRVGVHGADAGSVVGDIEQGAVALGGGVVAAIERGAAGAATTAREAAILLDQEIGAGGDQLGVAAHIGFRRL